ncbi:MAG: type II secretion system F family protein [Ruminococcaceae bacterium]|nr:type II secretion system F family protein [Oscillospiraceae bacterium]
MSWKPFGQTKKIRQQTLQLVSELNRWCQVREDLLFAFRKCMDHGLAEPLRGIVADFLARVQGGMPLARALDLMQQSNQQEHFQDMMTAIRFNLRHRGDLPTLLDHLEWQMNRVEEEYSRRKLTSMREQRMTLTILLLVPMGCLLRLAFHQTTRDMLLNSVGGRLLSGLAIMAYLLAVAAFFLIRRKTQQ